MTEPITEQQDNHDEQDERAVFTGGYLDLGEMQRKDTPVFRMSKERLSAIKTLESVPEDELTKLLLASFDRIEQADRVVNALNEAERYGMSKEPIWRRVMSWCAVRGGTQRNRVGEIITALIRQEHYTNTLPQRKNKNARDALG